MLFPNIRVWALLVFSGLSASAEDCRVLIDGTGCRTRQLAIQRIFEKIPGVDDVIVLPRKDAPAGNQRIFIVRSAGAALSREKLIEALGKRAKHYRVLTVTPENPAPVSAGAGSS